jgi:hypothetical protein
MAITVNLNTNTIRPTVIKELDDTPFSVLEEFGISTKSNSINLDGVFLKTEDELKQTFAQLGVKDGGTVNLNSIVKADGNIFSLNSQK